MAPLEEPVYININEHRKLARKEKPSKIRKISPISSKHHVFPGMLNMARSRVFKPVVLYAVGIIVPHLLLPRLTSREKHNNKTTFYPSYLIHGLLYLSIETILIFISLKSSLIFRRWQCCMGGRHGFCCAPGLFRAVRDFQRVRAHAQISQLCPSTHLPFISSLGGGGCWRGGDAPVGIRREQKKIW